MFKVVLEKAEESEIKLPTYAGSSKKQESSRKTSISALLTMPKPLTVWPPCLSPTPGVQKTHVHQVGDAIQPSHPLSPPSPRTFNLSQHLVFSNESALHIRWPKYWRFGFSSSLSNEYSGLMSYNHQIVF